MINYGKHFIDRSDVKHVKNTLYSGWLTQGPKVKIFEDKLKKFLRSKYSLVVNSGTAALHLACISIGIKKNDISNASESVPGINKLPIVGKLFQGKTNSDTMSELLVFIAPRVL